MGKNQKGKKEEKWEDKAGYFVTGAKDPGKRD